MNRINTNLNGNMIVKVVIGIQAIGHFIPANSHALGVSLTPTG